MLQLNHVWREYGDGDAKVSALRDISMYVAAGAYLAVMGPSGSGKSTLLNVMGGVDRVTSGEILFDGMRFDSLDEEQLTGFRRGRLAYVFQQYHLISSLTVLENVMLPLVFSGNGGDSAPAISVLRKVGLSHRMGHRPSQLSGGEQQRAAIARALVGDPSLILADEPTGNLDQASGHDVLGLFEELNREGRAIVMVTHNPDVARCAAEIVTVVDGTVVARDTVDDRRSIENSHTAPEDWVPCSVSTVHEYSAEGPRA
ncbi:ABC transporter ATP-binding protein [Chloroflexota bacterium]